MTKLIAQAIGRKKQDGERFNTIWKDRAFSGFGLFKCQDSNTLISLPPKPGMIKLIQLRDDLMAISTFFENFRRAYWWVLICFHFIGLLCCWVL